MKISKIKVGDKISHYCYGFLVDNATVTEITKNSIKTKHAPVRWGNDEITESQINESCELQKKWGRTDKNGLPCKGSDFTPSAFFNEEEITLG